jgi:hypothetical protein
MLKVTLDIFSGRPNPSWILDEQEAREVLRDITINQGSNETVQNWTTLAKRATY